MNKPKFLPGIITIGRCELTQMIGHVNQRWTRTTARKVLFDGIPMFICLWNEIWIQDLLSSSSTTSVKRWILQNHRIFYSLILEIEPWSKVTVILMLQDVVVIPILGTERYGWRRFNICTNCQDYQANRNRKQIRSEELKKHLLGLW